jgi:ATP-dependent helicase/nuclease subunit A
MATGISAYAACPRRYKYQFVDGHPGLGEGAASAASIGTLAHLALELDLRTAEELKLNGGVADMDVVEKALEQANNFREREAFARFRDAPIEKELRFSSVIGDIRVYGIADAVGEDFVLDYKTDAVPDPEKHSLQLWAYARALGKQKAYIAYLRHDRLDEIDAARLAELDATGYGLIERLRAGDFAATASEAVCLRCTYKAICDSAFDPADRASLI